MSRRILIVDDSAVIRTAVRRMFEGSPRWEVCGEAVDGRDAIVKAQQLTPDLILLDLSMPVMNGLEAARELKRITPRVPLLMFTTFPTAQLSQEALGAGCAAIISKTDSPQSLLDAVQGLLTY